MHKLHNITLKMYNITTKCHLVAEVMLIRGILFWQVKLLQHYIKMHAIDEQVPR